MKLGDFEFIRAGHPHSGLLLEWRNDPQTVSSSISNKPVSQDEHNAWFSKALERKDLEIYVALRNGVPVGTVRLERRDPDWELSWTVAPEFRGRGWGKEMVLAATRLKRAILIARVKVDNPASLAIVKGLGFRQLSVAGSVSIWRLEQKNP